MRILFIGDVMGRPGRKVVERLLPEMRSELGLDFVIANGENLAGGKGITEAVAEELFDAGADVLTGGNHSFANKKGVSCFEEDYPILRPANYPENRGVPGSGFGVYESAGGHSVGVLNLQGRVFLPPLDCPFQAAERILPELKESAKIIIVDFHAEASSEKIVMGWFLDGKASAVLGTHTHVQTADERVLPEGTAYVTDVGMTGAHDGVIGVQRDVIIKSMISRLPVRHKIAEGDLMLCGVLMDIDPANGRCEKIERVRRAVRI